jgi:Fe-S-cluster-containing dehydrogenase component
MKKWHMVIDVEKCEDCNNCFLACKDEHVDNEWPKYTHAQPKHGQRWINILRKERGQFPIIDVAYRPTPCMHCDNAPCIKATNAIIKRPDGIVLIDPVKSKGQNNIVNACPYGAIWWNEDFEVPQKCTFCAHLIDDGWKQPRCVQVCPTGALRVEYIEDAELSRIVVAENLEVLFPELNTTPSVYYKNLYRFDTCFIAGSVAVNCNGLEDCAVGVNVKLFQGKTMIAETVTDSFGDFKLDNLMEKSGSYSLEIKNGEHVKNIVINLESSIYIGTILCE